MMRHLMSGSTHAPLHSRATRPTLEVVLRGALMPVLLLASLAACAPAPVENPGTPSPVLAADRRTNSAYMADQSIETRLTNSVKARYGTSTHVNVQCFNRQVLLTGEVPDERTQTELTALARDTDGVRMVFNETRVTTASGLVARSQDSWITSEAKARMLRSREFAANHVKVITEAGVVYLMGLVKKREGDVAADIASRVQGTQRVVTLFEYMD